MASTTNYSWTTPDDTDLVKDGAAAIRTLGSAIDTTVFNNAGAAIAKTIVDAKGDLIVASAADTPARLAVGTNGQYLVADSAETTGLKWAALSTDLSVSLITNGTLSGSSVTLSSLSSYDTLILIVYDINQSNTAQFRMRVNNNSTSNYWSLGFAQEETDTYLPLRNGTDSFLSGGNLTSGGTSSQQFIYVLTNCKAAGFTTVQMSASYNSTRTGEVAAGIYAVAEAVSSLVIAPTAGTFNGGNYRIYGG